MGRKRRRATRVSPVAYDRAADTPVRDGDGARHTDGDRVVEYDDDAPEQLTGLDFYLNERPPHHG